MPGAEPGMDPTGSPMGDGDPPPPNGTIPARPANAYSGFSRCQGHPSIAPCWHWGLTSPCQSCSSPGTHKAVAARLPRHQAVGQRMMPSPCKCTATLSRAGGVFPFREEGNSARPGAGGTVSLCSARPRLHQQYRKHMGHHRRGTAPTCSLPAQQQSHTDTQ